MTSKTTEEQDLEAPLLQSDCTHTDDSELEGRGGSGQLARLVQSEALLLGSKEQAEELVEEDRRRLADEDNRELKLCVFENLADHQAEKMLQDVGSPGIYLITLDTTSQFCVVHVLLRSGANRRLKIAKYPLQSMHNGWLVHVENTSLAGITMSETIEGLAHHFLDQGVLFRPIFGRGAVDASLSFSVISPPPQYKVGQRYPNAPKRSLPTVKGIHSSLVQSLKTGSSYGSITATTVSRNAPGCCHRMWHTDPAGSWWKPHKAGPCMAALLVVAWILFLLLFGWAVAIFVVFGLLLLGLMYAVNFICTCSCADPLS